MKKKEVRAEDYNSRITVCDIEEETNLYMYSDVGNWPIPLPDNLGVDLIEKWSELLQNKDGMFSKKK